MLLLEQQKMYQSRTIFDFTILPKELLVPIALFSIDSPKTLLSWFLVYPSLFYRSDQGHNFIRNCLEDQVRMLFIGNINQIIGNESQFKWELPILNEVLVSNSSLHQSLAKQLKEKKDLNIPLRNLFRLKMFNVDTWSIYNYDYKCHITRMTVICPEYNSSSLVIVVHFEIETTGSWGALQQATSTRLRLYNQHIVSHSLMEECHPALFVDEYDLALKKKGMLFFKPKAISSQHKQVIYASVEYGSSGYDECDKFLFSW